MLLFVQDQSSDVELKLTGKYAGDGVPWASEQHLSVLTIASSFFFLLLSASVLLVFKCDHSWIRPMSVPL